MHRAYEKMASSLLLLLLPYQVNAAEKSQEARAQLEAARARHHKLVEARRTVEALQSALEAGQAQVHHHCFASSCDLDQQHSDFN